MVLRIIMYVLLIISSFIFNEFVVINICGLANGTQLFLDYKESNDFKLIDEVNNGDDLTTGENNSADNV